MRLEMGMEARLQLQQKLVLAPQIIQSIEILQLPSVNLLEYVEQALAENDALEVDMPGDVEILDDEDVEVEGDVEADRNIDFVAEDWEDTRPKPSRGEEGDKKLEALQNTAGREASLQDRLAAQLRFARVPEELQELCVALVYNLDDQGYLAPHRFVNALLESTDEHGYLERPLADVVAGVDGVAAVKVPTTGNGVTPEQVEEAWEARERHLMEAQRVVGLIQHIRAMPGGGLLTRREVFLRYPLVEVLEQEGGRWTFEEAEAALRVLQSLEPTGVAGRDMAETLVLQLDPDDLLYLEKRQLLEQHLEDLTKNRMQKIARGMGLQIDEVQLILEEMRGLDMKPGARLSPVQARAIHPDILVVESEGEYLVELINSYLPALTVSPHYTELMYDKYTSKADKDGAAKKVERARWLIDAIAQRQATLTKVAQRIFHHQRAFLDHGENALRPLKMQTVADELGIHVSTVSRAIAEKWAQTPQGVKPLKFFFTGGTETTSGAVESRHSVKNRVKAIIDAEDATSPLSDDDVASKLREQGLEIARRTVTKYRKQLGIPSSRQRRQWV